MSRIANAQHIFGFKNAEEQHAWVLSQARQRLRILGIPPRRIGSYETPNLTAVQASARVNHGQWLADCPSAHCRNAMVVLPGAPYLCALCLNADIGYQYRLVAWPSERGAIEMILAERPNPENQNWEPGETLEQLQTENDAHAAGVLS